MEYDGTCRRECGNLVENPAIGVIMDKVVSHDDL